MRWLFKTEPTDYAFARLVEEARTSWTGVRNAIALRHLRAVRKGDDIFIYHTGREKRVVGLARAAADAAGDAVEIVPVRAPARAVSLAEIRSDAAFRDFALVRFSRLSVMPTSTRRRVAPMVVEVW